ncbi:hypothetical protein [Burkholderia gladioli]|uniref:hypothetical protein n=1 Tax=Burkholderia gladioli TaxID=28095 RepID=UPI001CC5EC5A|nr:hypothetical protein [Burkholderia gladioli]
MKLQGVASRCRENTSRRKRARGMAAGNRADEAMRDYAGRIACLAGHSIARHIVHLFIYPVAPTSPRQPDGNLIR